MKIETNFTSGNFAREAAHWIDAPENRERDANECKVGTDWHCGVGNYTFDLDGLLMQNNTTGGLLISGVYCSHVANGQMFKDVCVVAVPDDGSCGELEVLDGFIRVRDGKLISFDDSPVYGKNEALGIFEQFGYDFCASRGIEDYREDYLNYFDYSDAQLKEVPFCEWFSTCQLIDEDQLPEAEFEGPEWTYCDFLDWADMEKAFFAGGERWRRDVLAKASDPLTMVGLN